MTIGDRIRLLRVDRGLTLQELADKLGVQRQTIYKYENNIVTNIPVDRIMQLSEALEVTPAKLIGSHGRSKSYYNNKVGRGVRYGQHYGRPSVKSQKDELHSRIDSLSEEKVVELIEVLDLVTK